MFGVPATERVFWRDDTCTVRVSYDDPGALVFYGDYRHYLDGYEYAVSVVPDQFDKRRAELARRPRDRARLQYLLATH
jgi:hypothetical protein